MTEADTLNLDAYLQRIGYTGRHDASGKSLTALHTAHLAAIPFENVDVLMGRSIQLDVQSLQSKLVDRCRGGYCFEQNTLFAAVLRHLGFDVTTLEARVRPPGAAHTLPRTHMVLRVDLENRAVLADVGFGGDGPLEPVDLDGTVSRQGPDSYRVVREESVRVLQLRSGDDWRDLYAFTLHEVLPIDFEVANHYTSTFPTSRFVTTLTAQLSLPEERRILRGRTYTVRRGSREETRHIDDSGLLTLLREEFGLDLSPETELEGILSRPPHEQP